MTTAFQSLPDAATAVASALLVVGAMQCALHIVQLLLAARALREAPPEPQSDLIWRRSADEAPPISILAPAYNEAETIVDSVRSLLSQRYPAFDVIVINDGSSDATLKELTRAFALEPSRRESEGILGHAPVRSAYGSAQHPNLLVIDKENGGKADALNSGLNYTRNAIFCSVDADSMLEPDALLRVVQPFVADPERVVAAGGTVRIANGCRVRCGRVAEYRLPRNPLALMQTIEYMRAFLMARLAWSRVDALTIISGAFGLFRRSAVIDAGGYTRGLVGEDMELVVRLHRFHREQGRDYRVAFVPEPVCWTEAPESLQALSRQRRRWQRGSLETFAAHRAMLFNPRYGRVGVLGLGGMLLVDVLGPAAEVVGYLLVPLLCFVGALSIDFLLAFLAVSFVFGVAISVGSLVLEEQQLRRANRTKDLLTLTCAAVLENFGYRQLNSVWRLIGCWEWARGGRGWGEMQRKGFARAA